MKPSDLTADVVKQHDHYPGAATATVALVEPPVLHVAFGTDQAYARGVGAAIVSLTSRHLGRSIAFHVFTAGLPEAEHRRFAELANTWECSIDLYTVDVRTFAALPMWDRYPVSIYLRLLAPAVLSGRTDRLLYLDADVVACAPMDVLRTFDFQGAVVAAASDHPEFAARRSAELGLAEARYFNTGVVLINIPAWRSKGVSRRAIELLSQPHNRFWWPDQDALNLLLEGQIRWLDPRWNRLHDLDAANEAPPPDDTVLLHFTSSLKPWHAGCPETGRAPFERYARLSPWREVPWTRPSSASQMRRYAKALRVKGKLARACGWEARAALRSLWSLGWDDLVRRIYRAWRRARARRR